LESLDALLGSRTYVGDTATATEEDFASFAQVAAQKPDVARLPHAARWHKQMASLTARKTKHYAWPTLQGKAVSASPAKPSAPAGAAEPKALKGRAQGKVKQALPFDCVAVPCADRTKAVGSRTKLVGDVAPKVVGGKYYITTAINYANGWPHVGHAYEVLSTDAFARYHRMNGEDVFFMTGADEHGLKIAQVAETEGITPQQLVDRYVDGFKALNQRFCCSDDKYIRTTSEDHKKIAREVWTKCKENGDIYLDKYEGWYLVREERFVTDTEAMEWDFKDPGSGTPLKKMSEPSFFFRLGKYKDAILKLFEEHEEFIQPSRYRLELIERLKGMELRDLSVSRGTFSWGIKCPEDLVDGAEHVMYVWFDALTNYFTGVNGFDASDPLSKYWPADMHVIGKDITWFHTVIWPAILMSAKIPLPKSVVVHGFISGSDGRKMSKSYGNVVNPHDELDHFSCDTLRWYLCRESSFGEDIRFSHESIRLMHNAELADNLGNLVHRGVTLAGGSVPEADLTLVPPPFNFAEFRAAVNLAFSEYRLSDGAELTVKASAATNKWIADLEPWKMKTPEQQPERGACLRLLLESVYVLAHFFAPFIPVAADAIFKKLGTPPKAIPELSDTFCNLTVGTPVTAESILFEQFDVKAADVAAPAPKAEPKAAAAKPKAEKKKDPAPTEDPNQPLISKLDIRVGQVVEVWEHPEADRLFCEKIDVGDKEGPRQIVSGLREHYSKEQFLGRKLLAVCNMKPAKMRGVESSGMVLCAKGGGVVELLSVPDSCQVGDRVLPKGVAGTWVPATPEVQKKQKIWETVAKDLKTSDDRVACFEGVELVSPNGLTFEAPTLPSSEIS